MWNSFLENICENLFHPRVVVRHPQADPGEEGSKEGQELTAEDQDYPDNRVEVLLGHVVPFSGADPTHFSCSLMPWVVATATASASNLTWVQEQVTKQNGKNGRKSIFQGIAQPWHMKTFLTFENLIIMLTFKETKSTKSLLRALPTAQSYSPALFQGHQGSGSTRKSSETPQLQVTVLEEPS